jgi:hypothetical protein
MGVNCMIVVMFASECCKYVIVYEDGSQVNQLASGCQVRWYVHFIPPRGLRL